MHSVPDHKALLRLSRIHQRCCTASREQSHHSPCRSSMGVPQRSRISQQAPVNRAYLANTSNAFPVRLSRTHTSRIHRRCSGKIMRCGRQVLGLRTGSGRYHWFRSGWRRGPKPLCTLCLCVIPASLIVDDCENGRIQTWWGREDRNIGRTRCANGHRQLWDNRTGWWCRKRKTSS